MAILLLHPTILRVGSGNKISCNKFSLEGNIKLLDESIQEQERVKSINIQVNEAKIVCTKLTSTDDLVLDNFFIRLYNMISFNLKNNNNIFNATSFLDLLLFAAKKIIKEQYSLEEGNINDIIK